MLGLRVLTMCLNVKSKEMKKVSVFVALCFAILVSSCSNIPSKSVMEPLTTDELSKIVKTDTLFAELYKFVSKKVEKIDDINKAKYYDVTYSELYDCIKYMKDSSNFVTLKDQKTKEWEEKFGKYPLMVNPTLEVWMEKKNELSLDRYVKIEFHALDKEYYSYSGGLKQLNFAFKVTPLEGPVEQLKFAYRYSPKINSSKGEFHNCLMSSPVEKECVRYWKADYDAEKLLGNKTSEEFVRDYNIDIEVTDVRKDGKNYSIDDLAIPKSVTRCWDCDSIKYPSLYKSYKEDVIKEVINPDYKSKSEMISKAIQDDIESKYGRIVEFMKVL